MNLAAPSFRELRRRNAKAVEEFLRPLFSSVGQEAVFAADPLEAFQVFVERWVPDEPTRRQVEELLPSLGATDHREREQAMVQLAKMGRRGAVALARLDRSKLSAEQNLRIDNILRPYFPLPEPEAEHLRGDPAFLLDCLYSDDVPVRTAAWEQLRGKSGMEVLEFDPTADPATRSAALATMRDRLRAASDDSDTAGKPAR